MYEANVDDVGYRLVAVYTPARDDGTQGSPTSASTEPIQVGEWRQSLLPTLPSSLDVYSSCKWNGSADSEKEMMNEKKNCEWTAGNLHLSGSFHYFAEPEVAREVKMKLEVGKVKFEV